MIEHDRDHYLFVLGSEDMRGNLADNIQHIQNLTEWTDARVVAQTYPDLAISDPTRVSMARHIHRVKRRRSKKWTHSAALAKAWQIDEQVLLSVDLTVYTLDDLKKKYGFRFYRKD